MNQHLEFYQKNLLALELRARSKPHRCYATIVSSYCACSIIGSSSLACVYPMIAPRKTVARMLSASWPPVPTPSTRERTSFAAWLSTQRTASLCSPPLCSTIRSGS